MDDFPFHAGIIERRNGSRFARKKFAAGANKFLTWTILHLGHVHRHFKFMAAAAGENSGNRTNVAEIPAIRDGDVFLRWLKIVCRVKIQPADVWAKN
jgi:hypothetical protein